jgi:asparagine synthase (glutamine-hydrolysing)
MGSSRYKRISDLLMRVSPSVLKSHIFSQENYLFPRRELKSILQPDMFREFSIDELLRPLQRNLSAAEQQALFDMKYYLKDDLLVKVDRASMRHSLEARVPLLDYRIVEFSLNLSSSLKYRNGESKYLLKKLLYQHIPQELFNRPKWGFGIPLGKWLRGGLRNYMHDLLSDSSLRETGLLNPIQVNILIRRFENGEEHLYNRLWLLMMLQQWALAEKSEAR